MVRVSVLCVLSLLILTTAPVFGQSPLQIDSIATSWQGALDVQGVQLRLVVHFDRNDEEALTATMDSPDQGATGLSIDKVVWDGHHLILELPNLMAKYEGDFDPESMVIDGTWSQGGMTFDLDIRPQKEEIVINRPQHPQPPYPYRVEEVTYENPEAGITLAGTLTLPEGGGPLPAVILISGSGAQDRDETVFNHKPFLVLADHLTRHGIAVLRFDERGVGQSTGDFATATSKDFADDVSAAVTYLQSYHNINPDLIGLLGHSEGGLVAPMVAVERDNIAFIVLMAAPGLPGEEILYLQSELINRVQGVSEDLTTANNRIQKQIFGIVKSSPDAATAKKKLHAAADDLVIEMADATGLPKDQLRTDLTAQFETITTPWFRFFLTYDPRPALSQLTCPLLAINGSRDLQVPAEENLAAINKAATQSPEVTIEKIEHVNHLFQTSATGDPMDYAKIEETIAPQVLDVVSSWIKEHTTRKR